MGSLLMEYGLHPSQELKALFRSQPFPHQGQEPNQSTIIFLGQDANYSAQVSENKAFFRFILEYHRDGVNFWKKHGVHHPFLLPDYPFKKNTGGVPYHRNFAKLGFDSGYADKISFIELINQPTTGRTEKAMFWSLFDVQHARLIDELILSTSRKVVIIAPTMFNQYMQPAQQRFRVFNWMPAKFSYGGMTTVGNTLIYGAPHFSSATKTQEFEKIGRDLKSYTQ